MSDVFVSYKAEDRRRVKPLVDALEAEGYSVWWDEQIGGGAPRRHSI
jgi:serine/threonine-protein kinase